MTNGLIKELEDYICCLYGVKMLGGNALTNKIFPVTRS